MRGDSSAMCGTETSAEGTLAYNRGMRRTVPVVLILGFLCVDFLFFHDLLKPGEVTTLPQYLTGFLSLLVFVVCAQSLLKPRR
jgi:hypothetical protein